MLIWHMFLIGVLIQIVVYASNLGLNETELTLSIVILCLMNTIIKALDSTIEKISTFLK